jgi:hypothetical protein
VAALLVVVTASLGSLAACGSDDDQQAEAALKSQILGNNAMTGSGEITSKEASCIAHGAVDELSVDRLQEYKILDSDLEVDKKLNEVPLSAKDADALAGVFIDCSDVEKIFEDRLVDQLADGRPKAAARVEACVRDAVTADSVRGILAQSFQKTDATAYADLSKKLGTCR